MPGIIDRLPTLFEEFSERLPEERARAADAEKDKDGGESSFLQSSLRFLGVAKYVLNGDVEAFRKQLAEGASLRNSLFERYDRGEPIDGSYVTMLTYQSLFDALAAGDIGLAESLASNMGGRDKIEKWHDHPFDYAMGYTLKWFVLGDHTEMERWADRFSAYCEEKGTRSERGYAVVFRAILRRNTALADEGLTEIVAGHKRQSRGRGVFAGTEDEVLCVWGLGMANLARSRGLMVQAVPPLIPDDLLLECP